MFSVSLVLNFSFQAVVGLPLMSFDINTNV